MLLSWLFGNFLNAILVIADGICLPSFRCRNFTFTELRTALGLPGELWPFSSPRDEATCPKFGKVIYILFMLHLQAISMAI